MKIKPPIIILEHPQMAENIGFCARAMKNCSVQELRLVAPRDGWPNPKALPSAANASEIIENAKLFSSLEAALEDLHFVAAVTARQRNQNKPVYTSRKLAQEMCLRFTEKESSKKVKIKTEQKWGLLFGPERSGLGNDSVSRTNAILTIPLNPDYPSLNLGQAVLLTCYDWQQEYFERLNQNKRCEDEPRDENIACSKTSKPSGLPTLASQGDLEGLTQDLIQRLDTTGFLSVPEKRKKTIQNIRNIFMRQDLTGQEVQTLRGILVALTKEKLDS